LEHTKVHTDKAPTAIGPYSQAIRVGEFVYTAGQVGLDPATGQLVEGGIMEQTRQTLDNINFVLQAASCSMLDVVKTTVFLSDMSNFAQMNEIYKEYFSDTAPPARSTVQVAALPRSALVEIECIAVAGGSEA
jgi:2-iminobutanoate/2-iminopropanoate deaminase